MGALALSLAPLLASAHVTVKPAQVATAAFQTFTVGVPNEKDVPTVAVRLIIPQGLNHVMPNVKAGWKIEVKKEKTGSQAVDENGNMIEEERVSEILWTGGSVPVGQRDEFAFSAQVSADETIIAWKAYQTYAGGVIVAWDMEAASDHGFKYPDNMGPYSKTSVLDGVSANDSNDGVSVELIVSLLALVLSVAAYLRSRRA